MIAKITIQTQYGKMGQGGIYEMSKERQVAEKFAHSVEDAVEWAKGYNAEVIDYPLTDGGSHKMITTEWAKDEFYTIFDPTFPEYSRLVIYIVKADTI